ncbi:MAG TPA: RluA family pseudouridine synthase [Flavisolibacter sp.]|nr:RluA family pseudouridine synthase [Flavisolibacter sp.]
MQKIEEFILEEDENLVAINKPSGLLTIPDREGKEVSLKQILKAKYGDIFTVHRLDKDTSGIVVFAKREEAHKQLSQLFEARETVKIYNGFVLGSPFEKSGIINEPIAEHPVKKGIMTVYRKGKESITEYEVLDNFKLYSWMQFHILTGRTHQIRVHMKHLGHPIVCDDLYGDGKPVFISTIKRKKFNLSKNEEEERPILSRLALHASKLKFELNNKKYELEAELPKDLRALLQQLNKNK